MAECPAGRTNRGIRSQFRLGVSGLGLLKGLYPTHVGDIMDTEQSSTSGVTSAREFVSPSIGTRTRTVREYEETIDELQKENFNLKLQLHFYEKKFSSKGKSDSPDTDTFKVVLDLKLETEALHKDLACKEKLLQDAVERAEKYESDFKELEIKCGELQKELSSLSELPSKQEFSSFLQEKENLIKQNESFQQTIAEKDQEIQVIREQIEILANQNTTLEEKIKKRNIAIQNLVYNNCKEKEMFPEELKNVVCCATQAAKSQNKEGLVVAVKSFASTLNKIMSSSSVNKLNESKEKENVGSPRAKCLKEEFLEKSSAFLPSQTKSSSDLSHIEGLTEALSSTNSPSCKKYDSLDSTVHDSFARGKLLHEGSVNVCKKDIVDYLTFSPVSKSAVEEKLKLPIRQSGHLCSGEVNLIDIESLSLPPVYPDLMCQDNLSEEHLLIKENEKLKLVIEELRTANSDSKHGIVHLHDKGTDALKASDSACTQTDIVGSHLLSEYEKTKLQKDAKLSNNVDELREDVLLLLLTIEDKNKELLDIKQTLAKVQEDLSKALSTSSNMLDKEYMNERNELHERLAFSSSVNEELMKHLRNLETFMEDLLKHKFDSSMESLSEKSDVLSSVSRCLNESLKLSNVLSNHLSFCEGSKLFEECGSTLYGSIRFSDANSLPNLNASEMIVPPDYSLSYPDDVTIRTHHYEESIPIVKKSDEQTNKELDSQLCWRCWQQFNSFPVHKPEDSNVVRNISPKCMPYASSDSDIWSEPDRNISMQRIGISLENSPVSSKSPRKSRFKDKRALNKLNSNLDTSSSEVQRWSRQRRHGSVSRRLFGRDSIKGTDLVSEKFYFLLAEKYSKLNMLLEALENIKDSGITNEVWMKMNDVVASVKEAIQKLHITKENAKNYPSTTCQKCVMLELFMDLKSSHIEGASADDLSVVETEILQQFQNEVQQLKEACQEPFSLLAEIVDKRSQSTQSDIEQATSEFENAYNELNTRNEGLKQSLEEVKRLLSKEKEASQTVQSENKDLYNRLKKLSKELSELRQRDEKLSARNEDLVKELESVNKKNLELISSVADLEQKKRRSSDNLEELTETLQLNKSDLIDNEHAIAELKNANNALTYENKKLHKNLEEVEKRLSGEKESLKLVKSENQQMKNQINNLSKELQEVKQNEDNLSIRNEELIEELTNMKQKNLELASAVTDLDLQKEKISADLDNLTEEMQLTKSNLNTHEQSVIKLKNDNIDLNHKNENLNRIVEEIKRCLAVEKEASKTLKSENRELYDKINNLSKELLEMRLKGEKLSLKNEELAEELACVIKNNSELTSSVTDLEQKKRKLSSTKEELSKELQLNKSYLEENKQIVIELKNTSIDLSDKNKNLNRQLEEVQRFLSSEQEAMKLVKTENNDLCHKIRNLTEELLEMRMKKDKLSVRNEELVEELANVNRKNIELTSTVADLDLKKERFSSSLDELTEELQLNKSDLDDNEQTVIKLKNANNELNYKNENMNRKLEEFKRLLSTEQEAMKSIKSDNKELCNQINSLTKELLDTRQKKDQLSLQNEELFVELDSINRKNSELTSTVTGLEQREQRLSCSLNESLQELQLNKSHLDGSKHAETKLKSDNIDLCDKNENLNRNLEEIKRLLSNENESLKSVKSENRELNNQINNLTKELVEMRQKEEKLSIKNEELAKELANIQDKNFELSSTVGDLKENKRKSSDMLVKLTEKLQSKSSLVDSEKLKMSELEDAIIDLNNKNKSLSRSLDEVNTLLAKEEEKLKSAKSENLQLCNKINDLKREILETKQNGEELSELKRKNLELRSNLNDLKDREKEANAALKMLELVKSENLELCSQISPLRKELMSLKQKEIDSREIKLVDRSTSMIRKKEELILSTGGKCCTAAEMLKLAQSENLELKKDVLDLKQNELISTLKNDELSEELTRVNKENSDLSATVKDLKEESKISSTELEQLTSQLQELKLDSFNDKNAKTKELEDVITDLKNRNKTLNQSLDKVKGLLSKEKEMLHLARSENLDLSNQINSMKEELFSMQQKELKLSLKNKEIVQELKHVNQNNYELKSTLEDLEEKKKEYTNALDLLTVELQKNKLNLVNKKEKCLEYEKKLNEQMKISAVYEEKLQNMQLSASTEKEQLQNNLQVLKKECNQYQAELESLKNVKVSFEEENAALSTNLRSKSHELVSLEEKINNVLEAKRSLSVKCENLEKELANAKDMLQSLQEKCSAYEEEVLSKFKISEDEYCQKLKELEAKSLSEKEKLLAEISKLSLERKDILQKLDAEKERYEKLLTERKELNKRIAEGCEQISSLQQLNEELKNKQQNLLQRNAFFEKALHSSNTECGSLSKDLKILRETLQNLESKCAIYEKEIVAAAGIRDNLVECLLSITTEISDQRQKLNELCKGYGREIVEVYDETSVSDMIPTIDDDNVKNMCNNLCIESKRLIQSIDFVLEVMKSFYKKSLGVKSIEEKFNLKATSMSKQMEFHKAEEDHLKSQNDKLQHIISELQKSISEKEKSIQYSAFEIQSLKGKINNCESEIERGNELLKRKDDEVTKLQERVFNLQSYVNTIMADKTKMQQQGSALKLLNSETDPVSSTSQLPTPSAPEQASKEVQVEENVRSSPVSSDESLASGAEKRRNSCCQQLLKKYQSLQTKLALCKKRIEILEKEKNDLREHYLNQIKVSSTTKDNQELINSKLVNLESELEKKKAFISELKAELHKTGNSLINKEKELEDLRKQLSESEKKSKDTPVQTEGSPKTNDTNFRTLKIHKWKLIQTIFDIQKRFYEKRGIHLNYIDKFREHVNSQYSMQLTQPLSKSESLPLFESHGMKLSSVQEEDKLQCLVGLKLDIECLENLKIFLNRFFVPCMLQASQDLTNQLSSAKRLSVEIEAKKMDISDIETLRSSTSPAAVHLTSEDRLSIGKSLSLENFVTSVSHSLDCIQSLFTSIGSKYESLEITDLPAKEESINKAEVKDLLVKISEEVKGLQGGVDKLSSFNAHLKNLDFFVAASIPLSFSRADVSDRESLMSEETIGISRSESPLSIDEARSLKLSCPETLHLDGQTLESKANGDRGTVVKGHKAAKVRTAEGSCDSVCQRSHYSSPDLGIESDPNHESSAPEQKEAITLYRKTVEEKKFIYKPPQPKTAYTETESAGRFRGITFCESLYSIGKLQHYELLKREIQESLVGIKSVLVRTGDGLHHVAKYTSPRKTLEYSTLKAIKDSCASIEVCLKEAYRLINEFWTAPCPTEREWKVLLDENQRQREELRHLNQMLQKQEKEYKKAIKRLEHSQLVNAHMEKKISKKLVKTKKDIRLAEQKLLENMCQNLPPVPKYPSEQADLVPQTNDV